MYKLELSGRVRKAIKKLDKPLQKLCISKLKEIQEDPYRANKLTGDLKGLWSYHFNYKGVFYRIIYRIIEKEALVVVVLISSRENIYERLRRIK